MGYPEDNLILGSLPSVHTSFLSYFGCLYFFFHELLEVIFCNQSFYLPFQGMTFLAVIPVIIMEKVKFIRVFCNCTIFHRMWVLHTFCYLIVTNTLVHVVVRCVVMSSENVNRLWLWPLMLLLDVLVED